jgi:LysM repeat protein
MNNQSPLASQGSFVEQKNKGRARVKVAIFLVLAFHGIGLLALLMTQGCKPDKSPADQPSDPAAASTSQPASSEPTNPVAAPTSAPPPASNTATTAAPTPPPQPPPAPQPPPTPSPASPTPPEPQAQAQDYAIAQGDTLGALAKKFGVTVKAIEDANPGVQPTKLKIGQKIHIPAATPPAAGTTSPGGPAGAPELTGGEQIYAVKSGDTLSSIAKHFSVKVRAIRTANNLTTDRIVVGQKLKIPAKEAVSTPSAGATAPSDTTSPPASATPGTPAPK